MTSVPLHFAGDSGDSNRPFNTQMSDIRRKESHSGLYFERVYHKVCTY